MLSVEENMEDAVSGIGATDSGRVLDDVVLYLKATGKVTFTSLLNRFMYQMDNPKEELVRMVSVLQNVGRLKSTAVKTQDGKEDLLLRYIREGES